MFIRLHAIYSVRLIHFEQHHLTKNYTSSDHHKIFIQFHMKNKKSTRWILCLKCMCSMNYKISSTFEFVVLELIKYTQTEPDN